MSQNPFPNWQPPPLGQQQQPGHRPGTGQAPSGMAGPPPHAQPGMVPGPPYPDPNRPWGPHPRPQPPGFPWGRLLKLIAALVLMVVALTVGLAALGPLHSFVQQTLEPLTASTTSGGAHPGAPGTDADAPRTPRHAHDDWRDRLWALATLGMLLIALLGALKLLTRSRRQAQPEPPDPPNPPQIGGHP